MTRTNRTEHTAFTFDDGEVFTEAHRATVGGWANMMKRVEARCGGRVQPVDSSGERWTVAGRTFTTTRVFKV